MHPLVTIAIPTYKRLQYLKEAVHSALEQRYPDIEVLISQDATDQGLDPEIQEWCSYISGTNTKITYVSSPHNIGLAANWNRVASKAKGDYLMIIGDDDRLLPDTVERLVNGIRPGVQVVFSNHYLIDENGNRLEKQSLNHTVKFNRGNLKPGVLENPAEVIWQNAVPMSSALIRTEDVRRLKFKEELNTPEIEFYLRLANKGGCFFFIPDYTAEYRMHTNSATHAGLKVHTLLTHLISIPAEGKALSYKDAFIKRLSGSAVNRFLEEGNVIEARRLFKSKYYPLESRFTSRGIIHWICVLLPASWSKSFFHFTYRLRSKS